MILSHVLGSEALKRRPLARVLSVNTGIRQLARAHAYGLTELYPARAGEDGLLPDTLSADGRHPNAPGYARLAPVVDAALALALKGS